MKNSTLLIGMLNFILLISCVTPTGDQNAPGTTEIANTAKGKLFIIGGGKRPPELVNAMQELSGLEKENAYGVILPMSSSEPDSAIWYAKKQFTDIGVPAAKLKGFNFKKDSLPKAWIDSLRNADLIYISGGDQNRFMEVVKENAIQHAIQEAYSSGAVIAGTSAGAAVMSKKMITGDELKHPEYTGDFKTIEAENIEIATGLGLTDRIIVDQHFIRRMRMNRLISVAIEHPDELCIGIDESTAVVIEGDSLRTLGISQVITLKNNNPGKQISNGLLGEKDMSLSVLLPGEKIGL